MSLTQQQLQDLRQTYKSGQLTEAAILADPLLQFEKWFEEALKAETKEANAMTLATVGEGGRPSARIVLLKGLQEGGFSFYTNYTSRKGQELAKDPNGALVFFWPELERQVRIEGLIETLLPEESEAYFETRPLESQLGAWASNQSSVVADRTVLEERYKALEKEYKGKQVPMPAHWGGYLLKPTTIEFWQGRPGRLHDRILYRKENQSWKIERLAP